MILVLKDTSPKLFNSYNFYLRQPMQHFPHGHNYDVAKANTDTNKPHLSFSSSIYRHVALFLPQSNSIQNSLNPLEGKLGEKTTT
jgi:hypothetical protein